MHAHYEDLHLHKSTRDKIIRSLADQFPKTFFVVAQYRLPLKLKIIDDLVKETDLDREALEQVLGWYCNHFAYRSSLLVGRARIDLDGKKAGSVTLKEQEDARKANIDDRIKQAKVNQLEELTKQKAAKPAARPAISNDNMNGVPVTKPNTSPGIHPELAEMQTVLSSVNGILVDKQFELVRPVLVAAALKDVIARAEKLIDALAHTDE